MTGSVLIRQRDVCRYEDGPRSMPRHRLSTVPALLRDRASVLACGVPEAGPPAMALTYDDGPDPLATPAVAAALREVGARATFFVLMEHARAHPQVMRELLADGHEIGLHGLDHTRVSTLPLVTGVRRVLAARRELESILGRPVRLYRPAYGALTRAQVVALRLVGLELVLWSAWIRDWERADAAELAERAAAVAHDGAILLLHDGAEGQARIDVPADFPKAEVTRRMAATLPDYTLTTVGDLLRRYRPGRTLWGESRDRARTAAAAERASFVASEVDDTRVDAEQTHRDSGPRSSVTTWPDATREMLSVVIACHDAADTLAEQLTALAEQSCPIPFEVIVADNASSDASAAIARSFADRLPLRVIDASAVQGPGHARNQGVAAAQGSLIAFCDADDVVAPDWLTAMVSALSDDAFVAGRVDLGRLNDARTRRTRYMDQRDGLQRSSTGLGLPHAGAGNMGVRREVFTAVGGFDEGLRCLQDSDLCWRIQLRGTPLTYHPDVLLHTRMRSSLRGQLSQAFLYGRSYAQLESRYGRDPGDQVAPTRAATAARGVPTRLGSARIILSDTGVRGLLWHLVWHLGRRRGTACA